MEVGTSETEALRGERAADFRKGKRSRTSVSARGERQDTAANKSLAAPLLGDAPPVLGPSRLSGNIPASPPFFPSCGNAPGRRNRGAFRIAASDTFAARLSPSQGIVFKRSSVGRARSRCARPQTSAKPTRYTPFCERGTQAGHPWPDPKATASI
jgi:hypothetical protein